MKKTINDIIGKAKKNWIATTVIIIVVFLIYWILIRPQSLLAYCTAQEDSQDQIQSEWDKLNCPNFKALYPNTNCPLYMNRPKVKTAIACMREFGLTIPK